MLGANVWVSRKTLIAIGVLAIGGTGWCAVRDSGLDPSLGSSRPAETPPADARSADARRIVLDFADCLDTAAETLASPGIGGASIDGCDLLYLSVDSRRGGLATVSAANASAGAQVRDLLRELDAGNQRGWDLLPMVGEDLPPGTMEDRLLRAGSRLLAAADDLREMAESIR